MDCVSGTLSYIAAFGWVAAIVCRAQRESYAVLHPLQVDGSMT